MHIQIDILPDSFPISASAWSDEMTMLMDRIRDHILDSTVNPKAAAIGQTTLLDPNGMIVATVDIRRT